MRLHPKVLQHFSNYPIERLWYLLFDYNRRELGPSGFEDTASESYHPPEVGYLAGMFSGLDFVFQSIDVPISIRYIETLHERIVRGVCIRERGITASGKYHDEFKELRASYRRDREVVEFGLISRGKIQNITRAGFKTLLQQIRDGDNYFYIAYGSTIHNRINIDFLKNTHLTDDQLYEEICKDGGVVCIPPKGISTLNQRLSIILNKFQNSASQKNLTKTEKIREIAECIQQLELTHPFEDANCRTMYLLLNKLLIQHNLSPTILMNPNCIDVYSISELVKEIKHGQKRFIYQNQRRVDAHVNPTNSDLVLYLENNQALASLLVFQAVKCIDYWDNINIADRSHAVDRIVTDICVNYPKLSVKAVNNLKRVINRRLSNAIYRKAFYQLASQHTLFYTNLVQEFAQGKLSRIASQVSDENQYGIELDKLNDEMGHSPNLTG